MEFSTLFMIIFTIILRSTTANITHQSLSQETTHNVLTFGAVGNGKTDDSKAFQSTWKAACNGGSKIASTIIVPSGKTFLLSPILFEGPCTSRSINVQILGNIIAPPKSAWKDKGDGQWLRFHGVKGLNVYGSGSGQIDGRGQSWWDNGENTGPTALSFSSCNNLQVSGLKHINSQRNHISISGCNGATISKLRILAPQTSPNTDGIDISSSTNIHIQNSVMATGDDCIAINGGTSNVRIFDVACGPGHGISIGSLGRNGRHEEVEDIQVLNCTFRGTQNGVRIKTWPGGSGFAKNISFTNINFIKSDNPVIIDQLYCPHKTCSDMASAVKISGVKYIGLRGTSISKNSIDLRCSKAAPCTNIILLDINIKSADNSDSAQCINAHGIARRCASPVVNCLKP